MMPSRSASYVVWCQPSRANFVFFSDYVACCCCCCCCFFQHFFPFSGFSYLLTAAFGGKENVDCRRPNEHEALSNSTGNSSSSSHRNGSSSSSRRNRSINSSSTYIYYIFCIVVLSSDPKVVAASKPRPWRVSRRLASAPPGTAHPIIIPPPVRQVVTPPTAYPAHYALCLLLSCQVLTMFPAHVPPVCQPAKQAEHDLTDSPPCTYARPALHHTYVFLSFVVFVFVAISCCLAFCWCWCCWLSCSPPLRRTRVTAKGSKCATGAPT